MCRPKPKIIPIPKPVRTKLQAAAINLKDKTGFYALYEMGRIGYRLAAKNIAELENWKKGAISVIPDMQAIGKELDLQPGQSVHDKILSAIIEMKKQIAELQSQLNQKKL